MQYSEQVRDSYINKNRYINNDIQIAENTLKEIRELNPGWYFELDKEYENVIGIKLS